MRRWLLGVILLASCQSSATPPPAPACPPAPVCPAPPHTLADADVTALAAKVCACDSADCSLALFAGKDQLTLDQVGVLMKQASQCHPDRATRAASGLDELAKLEADACACTDSACTGAVEERFDTWSQANADVRGTPEQEQRAGALVEQLRACLAKYGPSD